VAGKEKQKLEKVSEFLCRKQTLKYRKNINPLPSSGFMNPKQIQIKTLSVLGGGLNYCLDNKKIFG
jgi:hypothetical protein